MHVENTRALLIAVEVFLINLTESYGNPGGNNPNTNNGSTWFEAQENCRGRGLSTETGLDNKYYWTGRYKRFSDWIKIIGCYPDVNITNHVHRIQKEMPKKSVGACQEICKYENITTFAVKSKRCICLKGNVRIEEMSQILPSKCNFVCDNEDGIYSEDCGGKDAYNIYISDQKKEFRNLTRLSVDYTTVNNEHCIVLQCSSGDRKYMIGNCGIYYDIVCQNANASLKGAANWTNAMKNCKKSNFSSYLYGDLDLTNATGSCMSLPRVGADVKWIGIARQLYENEDQGWNIEEEENQFQFCQKCFNRKCSYDLCSNRIGNYVLCSNKSTEISGTTDITTIEIFTRQSSKTEKTAIVSKTTTGKQTTTHLTTSIPTKTTTQLNQQLTSGESFHASTQQETTLEINTAIISNSQQPEGNRNATHLTDEDDNVGSLIPIILGVVVPLVAIILLGIYIRRRNNVKNSKGRNKPLERKKANKTQTDINNPSYFVLEKPSSYELADVSMLDSESPYNETEEGEYDHLRNKDSRKKDEDDTYQHATSISNGDVSHYDYTTTNQREGDEKIEKSKKIISPELREDSTYTEVDTVPQNTYFVLEKPSPYDLASNSTLDFDSPYNETKEGEYDHLRKKESRKKIVDDTYQHATPVINVDASVGHYDTAIADNNQEVESNYDHMHESLNFNRNSENEYNYTT